MPEHVLIAHEPVLQKSKWAYEAEAVTLGFRKTHGHVDIPASHWYGCSCGAEFDTWDAAVAHLRQ